MRDHFTPNHDYGRKGFLPQFIVVHIAEGSVAGTEEWFFNPDSKVSAHYIVGKDGSIVHFVHESDTAWANGIMTNPDFKMPDGSNVPFADPNLVSISIEHEGHACDSWPEEQVNASAQLIKEIAKRWQIPLDRQHIIGHYQINPLNRPNCPAFDKTIIDRLIKVASAL